MKINSALFLAVCLSPLMPMNQARSAPIAATLPASNVYATTATLTGTVNPEGTQTQAYFQYGTTTNYGSVTATNTFAAGNTPVNVSDVLTNLIPGATYYYQLMVSNGLGPNAGDQLELTTGNLLVVTTDADDGGADTLRTIISNSVSGDTITFDPSLVGETILLTNGLILLTEDLSIDASALSGGMVIDGDANDAIFRVTDPETVVFSSLTLTNGFNWGGDGGGAIDNANGILTLNQCTLSGNTSTTADGGGAILNFYGSMTLNQCTVIGNYAAEGDGGGIYNLQTTLTLNQCTVSGNSTIGDGGGIYNTNGVVTLNECTVSDNAITNGSGGGLFTDKDSTLILNQSTISGNSCISVDSSGGGICSEFATVILSQCTLSGNVTGSGGGGGAIASLGFFTTLTMDQCTVSGNSATNDSGGGGIYSVYDTENITNSIIAGNYADVPDAGDMADSSSFGINFGGTNIVESYDNSSFTGPTPLDADPMLGPLADNGGPTQTMLLMVGSPAIDAGDDSATNLFTTDQRGYPIPSGLHVDIGAVEAQQAVVATLVASEITGTNAEGNGAVTPGDFQTTWSFSYGTTTNYDSVTTPSTVAAAFSLVDVSNILSSLAPATTYHYQIQAYDGVSIKTGSDISFNTLGSAPSVLTGSVTNFNQEYATILGSVNPNGADTQYYFQYGTSTNFTFFSFTNTIAAGNTISNVTAISLGLMPATTYYYQLVASNSFSVVFGVVTNFTTLSPVAPVPITLFATGTSATNTTLLGAFSPGYAITGWYFEYGTTTNYGSFTPTNTAPAGGPAVTVSNVIGGLSPGTTYYFQIVATNSAGTNFGGPTNFITLPAAPVAITGDATNIGTTNATLEGLINPGGAATAYYFAYGTTTNYGSFTVTNIAAAGNSIVGASNLISGLYPGVTYYYRIVATNNVGADAGSQANFTTVSEAPLAITGIATNIGTTNASLLGFINPGGATGSYYFQYGLTTNYGLSTATNLLAAGSATVGVSNRVTNLLPGLTYYYQIVAANVAGTNAGLQTNFTTSAAMPVTITEAATGVGSTNATVNGSINPGGAATTYYFQYGSTTNYGLFTSTNTVSAGNVAVGVSNTLSSLNSAVTYYYQLVATNSAGAAAGAAVAFTTVPSSLIIADSEIVVAITSPAKKFATTNSTVVIKGTIKSRMANPQLHVVVNTNAPILVTNGPAVHGVISWTCTTTLIPGANIITAETVNTNLLQIDSIPATITVFYATNRPASPDKSALALSVSPTGSGKISGERAGVSLEVNKVYTVEATPASGWMFNDWTIGTNVYSILGSNASLAFIMQSNLVLQANFVTNPFPAVAGVYNGLFSPATGVTEETSGFFSAAMASSDSGAYTGKLMVDGGSYPVNGVFDLTGNSQATIARSGKPPVQVVLHLNLFAPDDQMTGFIINFASNGWTSTLQADRAVFDKSNVNTNYVGKYTMVISPGSGAPTNAPGGYSYATLYSSSAGLVTVSGSLADNTAFSQSVPVSEDGNIPLYASLYGGKGLLTGWLTLTNLTTNQMSPAPTVVGTNLAWIKTNMLKAAYAAGFASTDLTATGSLYTGGFSLTNGTLTIADGGLSVPLVFHGVNVSDAKLTSTNTAVKGTITAASGVLTVTVPSGDSKVTAKGVILQGNTGTNGAGWFFGAEQSGYFQLTQ